MPNSQISSPIKLFYSYSHRDMRFRENMKKSLDLLERERLLEGWSDQQIVPGRPIPPAIRAKMNQADIMMFLFSPAFISSEECMKEWNYAKELASSGKLLYRVPIIVRPCAWLDVVQSSEEDNLKALPDDGKAITEFSNRDSGWQQVYEGIKAVINELRRTFIPKQEFINTLEITEFVARDTIRLQDIFVFLRLTHEDPKAPLDGLHRETISSLEELLNHDFVLIHGHETTGKTALAKYAYISLIENSQPVLYLDLAEQSARANETFLRDIYQSQFTGDYFIWANQPNKTLILDNLNEDGRSLEFIEFAQDIFDRIVVTTSTDHFYSYFIDDSRLTAFRKLKIEPLTRAQQQDLIRKRLELLEDGEPVTDGFVDRVEDHVNSVIISSSFVPRYPFHVLSIVQTHEKIMPTDMMSITSYGHCYYVLILAHIFRVGISNNHLDAALNLAEHLAFAIYRHGVEGSTTNFDFDEFLNDYRQKFVTNDMIVNRLRRPSYGIIGQGGTFRYRFMYYFFLGRFLARGSERGNEVISKMCEQSHLESNYLALLFTIHHTNDLAIIDDILLRTMSTLDQVDPATLNTEDTERFINIVNDFPEEILSRNSVEEERERVRVRQDAIDEFTEDAPETAEEAEDMDGETSGKSFGDAVYRILKNNKIMGQILRNKYGSLERTKIEEMVETISDSGLRLVNSMLLDQEELTAVARRIKDEYPDIDIEDIKQVLEYFSFFWTVVNIQEVVNAINVPEIRRQINDVVKRSNTPAYDLIGYFSLLGRANELTDLEHDRLAALLDAYEEDPFVQRVLSLRTQQYMNTHQSRAKVEQRICSLLNIKYVHRLILVR